MILRYASRELLAHPLRTLLAIGGVAVASAMLLDMLMLGGGLSTSFSELLTVRGYELRVSPRGTLPLDTDVTLRNAEALVSELRARDEVAGVAPVLAANALLETDDEPVRVFALGVDPDEQGVYTIREGAAPRAAGQLLVGAEAAEELGLEVGASAHLTAGGGLRVGRGIGERFEVVGIADFVYASTGERSVAMDLDALARLAGRDGQISFAMLRVPPGQDPEAAAASLSVVFPDVEIASAAELVEKAQRRLSYFRQLALILGTVSLVVTALLVGTIMAVSINDRYRTIAVLRAIGISRRSVLVTLAAEGLLLVTLAALTGLILGAFIARYLESILADFPGLPEAIRFFVFQPRQTLQAFLALLAAGAVAVAIPAWRAAGLPIARTLHEEEM